VGGTFLFRLVGHFYSAVYTAATGTDKKPVDANNNNSKKWTLKRTPFLTQTALPTCNQLSPVGNKQSNCQENIGNDNCLNNRQLSTKKTQHGIDWHGEK